MQLNGGKGDGVKIDVDALRDLTVDLINIPSPPGAEESAALFLEGYLEELGLRTWTQEVETGRRNVVGLLRGTGGGPTVMLMGHLDTVWAGDEDGIRGRGPGFEPRALVDGDWIYGLGAYNMKSGLTSAIAAVKGIVDSGASLRGNVILAGVVGETARCQVDSYQGARYRAAGIGAWHLVTNGVVADMAIVPEPTYFRASIVSGGYVYFRVATHGVPGGTYSRGGSTLEVAESVDALDQLLGLREAVREWGAAYTEANRFNGELAANVTVIGIDAGLPFRPTKIPALGRMYVEVDLMPGQTHQDVIEEFSTMIAAGADRLGLGDVDVDVLQTIGSAQVSPDEYVVGAVTRAHKAVVGTEPEVTFDGWMADTTTLTRAGIPALCFGPGGRMRTGGSGYYARDGEQCYLPDLVRGAEIYAHAVMDICSQDRRDVLSERASLGAGLAG